MQKSTIFIFCILMLQAPFISPSNKPHEKEPNITINNYITGSTSTALAHNATQTDQKTNLQQTSYNYLQTIISALHDTKEQIPAHINSIVQHKYKICLGLICASYIYVCYQLHITHNLLQNPTSWCNWKEIVSTQHLTCIPQNELIHQLLSDIQKKYLLLHKTTNTAYKLSPLDQFVSDISYELTTLQRYATIQKSTNYLYVSKILPLFHKNCEIEEKIHRLHIILNVFIEWQTQNLLKQLNT